MPEVRLDSSAVLRLGLDALDRKVACGEITPAQRDRAAAALRADFSASARRATEAERPSWWRRLFGP